MGLIKLRKANDKGSQKMIAKPTRNDEPRPPRDHAVSIRLRTDEYRGALLWKNHAVPKKLKNLAATRL